MTWRSLKAVLDFGFIMSLRRNTLQIVLIALSGLGSVSLAASYTVKPGETLYGIARAIGSSVPELQRLNKLETAVVRVGQVIVVPDAPVGAGPKPDLKPALKPALPIKHQVLAGETLFAISKKYAVDLESLQRANKLSEPAVRVGQVLLIPAVRSASVVKPVEPKPVEPKPVEPKPVVTGTPVKPTPSTTTKPVETKPVLSPASKPPVTKPPATKPVESKPPVTKPVEAKPVSSPASKPIETKPVASAPPKPVEAKPASSTPASSTPAKPLETKPSSSPVTKPVVSTPVKPVVSTPVKPVETKPVTVAGTKPDSNQMAPKPDLTPAIKPVPIGGASASGKPVRAVMVGKFTVDQDSTRTLPQTPSLGENLPASGEVLNTNPTSSIETVPAATKPTETKPAETKPAETKPAETKPAEQRPETPIRATRIPLNVVESAPLPDLGPVPNSDNPALGSNPASPAGPAGTGSEAGVTPTDPKLTDPKPNDPKPNDPNTALSTTGPISVGASIRHTVVYGDSLYRISVKYGLSVEAIKTANNLRSDALWVGQTLNIPDQNPVRTVVPTSSGVTGGVAGSATGGVTGGIGLRGIAERYLGVTYVYGGTTPTGLDCSGLVYIVYNELGVRVPRTSRAQFAIGEHIDRADLQEGDLVFFDTTGQGVSHVGIYLANDQFINAASNPGKVTISSLEEPYWARRYLGARRVISGGADQR
jgi:peptidoglycan DL-endopeptidase LytE